MSVQSVDKKGAQLLSIHYVSVRKICHHFSVEIASAELRDLIERVVGLYNRSMKDQEDSYKEIKDLVQPKWKVQAFEPFKMCVYAQIIRSTSRLSSWLKELGAKGNLEVQRVHYLFFLYRDKEIFALTTGQSFRVVQKFSDYRFPIHMARRLMSPDIKGSKKRPIVGSVILLTEVLKQEQEVSDSDAVDKLFSRVKFGFRNDSSIFSLSCFQNSKGKPLIRGMSAEIGLGLVRFTKEIAPENYPEILNHLSLIARKQKTVCVDENKTEEKDSEEFDFLDNFHPTDFTIVPQLNKALEQSLREFLYHDKELPPFDFCHSHRGDFFQSTDYTLLVAGKSVKWDSAPSAFVVMSALKAHIPKDENGFSKWLEGVKFTFKHQGKTESASVVNYFEGELRLKSGEVYWRLHTMWFEINADYLGLVHQEFRKMLESCLISSEALPEKWLSPKAREERKKALGSKKFDVEAEFNQKFLKKAGFYLGDKICPNKIELGDVFYFGKSEVLIFHVKEGFDHHTRDACSQILNAAKLLHHHSGKMKNSTNVIEKFYDMALEGGNDEYRKQVKAEMQKITKEDFVKQFSKKLVFVYAFADKVKEQRMLSREKKLSLSVKAEDLEKAHSKFKGKGLKIYQELINQKYLSNRGRLTSKFISSTKGGFKFDFLDVKLQRDAVFDALAAVQTQFDSTIAKLELISVRDEVKKLGFGFKILQIQREDYTPEDKTVFTRIKETQFELDELSDLDESEKEIIRGDIGEGDVFKVGEEQFSIETTEGDGACGLHALVGVKKDKVGKYTYPGGNKAARAEFMKRLKEKIKLPEVKKLWGEWMVNFLKDFLSPAPSVYTKMVFEGIDVSELKKGLANLDEQRRKFQDSQVELFSQVCDSQDCQEALKDVIATPVVDLKINPKQMKNLFSENLSDVLSALEETEIGGSLQENSDALEGVEAEREKLFFDFIQKPQVWDAYLKGTSLEGYYFSTQELQIAAHLFDKHVVIYTHRFLDQVETAIEGGDPTKEKVVIFHKGIHFSRCVVQV